MAVQAIIPTAIIKIKDFRGNYQDCRVLLDSESQVNLISEACARRMGLKRSRSRIMVNEIASSKAGVSKGIVNLIISNGDGNEELNVKALVMDCLSTSPNTYMEISNWDLF